jgi:hypothetical protein
MVLRNRWSKTTMCALALLAFAWLAGCASLENAASSHRTFNAPVSRVKPAMISALAGLGMAIASLEVRNGREILKARKAGSEVEIELETVNRSATRARVTARNGGLLNDDATADKIFRQTEKYLGKA